MACQPGDWVELVRDVDGGRAGQRGKVTSTAFLGGLDIELSNGVHLQDTDASAVRAESPSSTSGDGGCALVGVAAGVATVAAAVVAGWTRARWGA
ncbi:MAG TPA: hypothetical protein VHX38_26835 [Pseudonocardiaceae bacterium]|jgi:hypothetical protein|nr:hypothetical protein [Pseudonocardiaceae bacterium]